MNRYLNTILLTGSIVLLLMIVGGCRHEEVGGTVVVRTLVPPPPPATVYYGPAVTMDPVTGAVITPAPPPAPYVEEVGSAPGPDYIWIGGDWIIEDGRYRWVRGRWEHRPHADAHWRGSGWEHTDRGWEHRKGHWE